MKLFIILFYICIFGSLYADIAVVEDFETLKENQFPENWGVKSGFWYTSGKDNKTWIVKVEGKNKYLSAISKNDAYTIGKKFEYNLRKFPFIKWKWRAKIFPTNSEESKKDTCDSVLGLYAAFQAFGVPYSIKYIWSEKLPQNTILESPFSGRTKFIVIRSGKAPLNQWVEEKRNLLEDYKKAFGKEPDKNPYVIAVLTDSDNTHSQAEGDYDDIIVSGE